MIGGGYFILPQRRGSRCYSGTIARYSLSSWECGLVWCNSCGCVSRYRCGLSFDLVLERRSRSPQISLKIGGVALHSEPNG